MIRNETRKHDAAHVHDAKRVLEAGVGGARKNIFNECRLLDAPKTLKFRRIDNRLFRGSEWDCVVKRIADLAYELESRRWLAGQTESMESGGRNAHKILRHVSISVGFPCVTRCSREQFNLDNRYPSMLLNFLLWPWLFRYFSSSSVP